MSRRIDDASNFFRPVSPRSTPDARPQNQLPPTPQSTAANSSVLWRQQTNNQLAEARKRELEMLIGGATGMSAGRVPAVIVKAEAAYAVAYKNGLDAMRNNAPNAPANLIELNRQARQAYTQVLAQHGVQAVDSYRMNVEKATDILTRSANNSVSAKPLSEAEVLTRIQKDMPPGEYMVRVINRRFFNPSPYLTDVTQARMTGSEKAWMTPLEEVAGLKLSKGELLNGVGFDSGSIAKAKAGTEDYVLVVTKTADMKGVAVPTWDTVIDMARGHERFEQFSDKPPQFWDDVRRMSALDDKGGSAYKMHLQKMSDLKLKPNDYAPTLPKGEADVFLARNQLQATFGANDNFGGRGATLSPDGQVRLREYMVDNGNVADFNQHSILDLRNDGDVPHRAPLFGETPVVTRGQLRHSAVIGGGVAAVTTLAQTFGDVRSGNKSANQALRELPAQLATNGTLGSSVGAGSSVLESYATRGIEVGANRTSAFLSNVADDTSGAVSRFAGRSSTAVGLFSGTSTSVFGTVGRRALGGGVAGGFVNAGFASYDQIGLYRSGQVSGAQALGTIAGESAVGFGAGLSGAAAGAAIGSIVPGLGTVVGGVVGFGVGMGAGYIADKGLRFAGVDKAIARGVTSTIEGGQRLAADVKQVGARTLNQVQAAGAQTLNQAKAVGTRAVNQGRAVVDRAVTTTRAAVLSQVNAARNFGNRVSTGARSYAQAKLTQARQTFSHGTRAATQMYTQAKQQVAQTVNRTVERATQTYQQASSYVSNTVNQAQQTASNFVSSATSSLRSAFGW